MKITKNLIGALLFMVTAYAFAPKEQMISNDLDQIPTQVYVNMNNAIVGSDGEMVRF